jgi:hypothetical protein
MEATATATASATATKEAVLAQLEGLVTGALNDILPVDPTGNGGGATLFGAAQECQLGGSESTQCEEDETGALLTITYDECASDDGTVMTQISGTVTVSTPGSCAEPYPTATTIMATFVGSIEKEVLSSGDSYSVDEDIMVTFSVTGAGSVSYAVSGSVDASCADDVADVQTLQPVVLPPGSACPTGGILVVLLEGMQNRVSYTAGGGVNIDVNGDLVNDASYPSCTDPQIAVCFE